MNPLHIGDLSPDQRAAGTSFIRLCEGIGRVLRVTMMQPRITGLEHVPITGGVLFAANHTHIVDGPMLFAVIDRPVSFYVKSEAFIGPLDPILRRLGQIPVNRGVPERAPIVAALETLSAGGAVGVFPEGSRGSGAVASVQRGIAYLAVRSGVPVVPVACVGSAKILTPHLPWRRPPVSISFGRPVQIEPGARASRPAISAAAEQIRAAMAELLSESQVDGNER
ncbi:MAG: lysophospholipid acyltransferase family protein [Mycobacteriales bacterium]